MAYNTWKGNAAVGDIINQDDIDTLIDWDDNKITLKTNDTARFTVDNDVITVGGRLTGSNGAYFADRVGVGTATPASTLDVEGSVAIGATYAGSTAAPTNGLIVETTVGVGQSSPTSDNSTSHFVHIGGSSSDSSGLVLQDNEGKWEIFNNGWLVIKDGTESIAYFKHTGNKEMVLNKNLQMLSDSTVLSFGAGEDVTFTHDGGTGMDIVSAGTLDIGSTAGSMTIGPALADGQTLKLGKNGAVETIIAPHGTAGSELYSVTNTAGTAVGPTAAAIQLAAAAGGIGIRSAANLEGCIQIEADGGANETISIHSDQGTGVNTSGNSTDASINLISDVGGVGLYSGFNGDNAIRIEENGGTDGTIVINANQGNGVNTAGNAVNASISLASDVGGIGLYSGNDSDNAIRIETNGGVGETIVINSNQGTGTDSISLVSDAGGVTVDADLYVTQKIVHVGDTDTYIDFTADSMAVNVGGEEMILALEGGGGAQADKVTINNGAEDIDFQVKGSSVSVPNLLRTDAANNRVGIGHPGGNLSGSATLSIIGTISGSSTLEAVGATTLGSTLSVSGTSTFSGVSTHEAHPIFETGITIKNADASAGYINFYEQSSNGTNVCTFRGKSSMGNCTITLPGDTGTVVLEDNTVTLSNKTIASPTITGDLAAGGDTNTFSSANSTDPLVIIKNTTNDANGARLRFIKDKGAAGATNDVAGLIEFYADDAAQDQVKFAEIKAQVAVATNGQEGGKLTLSVAEHDGTSTAGLVLSDGNADGEIDVTVGAGAASVTNVSGLLTAVGVVSGANGTFDQLAGTALALQGGGITAAGNIAGAGALSGSGTLEMVGPTRLGSTLGVTGSTTLEGSLGCSAISGSGTLQMVGGTTIGQSLHVSGASGAVASIGLGTAAVHATAVRQLSIADGTQPQFATANQISIGSKQSTGLASDGATLTLQTECLAQNTALDAVGTLSHRITIWHNGTEYYLYLDPV